MSLMRNKTGIIRFYMKKENYKIITKSMRHPHLEKGLWEKLTLISTDHYVYRRKVQYPKHSIFSKLYAFTITQLTSKVLK